MKVSSAFLVLLLTAPLAAQERPEPGALPSLRAQMRGVLSRDPLDSWRSYLSDGLPSAVVEVVATFTEAEREDQAFQESVALLKQRLREMWGRYGDAASRDHAVAYRGDPAARVYPLGRALRP
jgi:hypothetical protein